MRWVAKRSARARPGGGERGPHLLPVQAQQYATYSTVLYQVKHKPREGFIRIISVFAVRLGACDTKAEIIIIASKVIDEASGASFEFCVIGGV